MIKFLIALLLFLPGCTGDEVDTILAVVSPEHSIAFSAIKRNKLLEKSIEHREKDIS
jgi:hypothetical protein